MTQVAELPDGTQLEFPDDINPAVMDAVVKRHLRKGQVSVGEDVARALPYSIPKVATSLGGILGDVRDLLKAGRDKLPQLPEWAQKVENFGINSNPLNLLLNRAPTAGELRGGIEKVSGPWYDPQTRTGKVADTALQTAATMGRNWVSTPAKAATLTGAVTAGTEGAGALTNDNPWARFAGGLIGGVGPTIANAARQRSGVVVRDAVGDITPEQLVAAEQMQQRSRELGIPLLGTESLDRGHDLAGKVMASLAGGQRMKDFVNKRPAQVEAAGKQGLIAPTRNVGTPAENAARAQMAATDVINSAEGQRSALVKPFYDAAKFEEVPPQSLRPVANEIQNLMFGTTSGSPIEKTLGNWHKQLFPDTLETVGQPPVSAPKPAAPKAKPVFNPETDDAITFIRKAGGINPADEAVGSLAKANPFAPHPNFGPVWRQRQGASNTTAGHSLDKMAQLMNEAGFPVAGPDDVMDVIANAGMGKPTFSQGVDYAAQLRNADPMIELTDTLRELTGQMRVKNAPRAPATPSLGVGAALPETNVGRLNDMYKRLGIEGDTSAIGVTAEQKMSAYPAQRVQSALGEVLKQNNPNIAQAQQKYAEFTKGVIDPLTAGPVGRLATKAGFDAADQANVAKVTSAISDTNSVRPDDIRTLYINLNKQDKQAFPGIAKTWIENEINAAVGDLRSGPNPTAGAKLRQALVGSPKQQANFDETMRGVALANGANPDEVVRGANVLMQTLERTGRTPGIGSPTDLRGEIGREIGKTYTADALNMVSGKPLGGWMRRFDDWITQGRYDELSKVLTAPDSVQKLAKMAKFSPNGMTARFYLATLLGLDRAISQ